MDVKLPGISGNEATRQIREFNKEVFILAQTAYAQTGDREKSMEAGCNDYISKPIQKDKLLEIINNHF
jgi:CheY-like chemotaxis protein